MRPVITALVVVVLPLAAAAQAPTADGDILLEAAEVIYEPESERAIARGRVMLARNGYTLTADEVVYDRRAATVSAIGEVVLVDDAGDTYYADRMELGEDLSDGFIEGIAVRLADSSLLVAQRADRSAGRQTELRDVTYTPCPVCPGNAPVWQINADSVTHDQEDRRLVYEDATFELSGVPVLYTPYFAHPDPLVERQSGFLAPTFRFDSNLGFMVDTPYYWAQAPNRDITFTPSVMTREPPQLSVDVRDLQTFGLTEGTASGTYASGPGGDPNEFRGHLDVRGRYDLTRFWDTGFDLNVASDRTYLRRYNISRANVLDSRLFVDRFENDYFIDASLLGFQTLRPDVEQGDVPQALPRLRQEFTGVMRDYGVRWAVTPDFLSLYRTDGLDQTRASIAGEMLVPRISRWGDIFEASARIRGDFYATAGDTATGMRDGDVDFTTRFLPRASFGWRRPYSKVSASGIGYEIEPIIRFTVAPTGVDPSSISNEDSQDTEFDETNLLLSNRFAGLDRFDEGSKASWAIRTSAVGPVRELWAVTLGQSYRFSDTDVFEDVSGLENQLSDFVGRIDLNPHEWVDLDYRFRVDSGFNRLSKSDLTAVVGPPWLRLAFGYLVLDENEGVEREREQEGRGALAVRFDDNWSLIAGARRNFETGQDIGQSIGLLYEDACLTVAVGVDRDFTSDGDAGDDTTVALRFSLKNLGEFGVETGVPTGSSE